MLSGVEVESKDEFHFHSMAANAHRVKSDARVRSQRDVYHKEKEKDFAEIVRKNKETECG